MALLRLPGLVDVHVHLREPGSEAKETFAAGTRAALAGGIVTVLDMPNNPGAPTITPAALADKAGRAAAGACCDIGFHYGATPDNAATFPAVVDQVFGLKLYLDHTTGTLLVERLDETAAILAAWPAAKPLLVHAEERTVAAVLGLIALHPRRVHFCHVSLGSEIRLIHAAKERGLPVTCEVAPHHLFLSDADLPRLGAYGLMKPPLRTGADVDALWAHLVVIDMIATDHAPHTHADKAAATPAYGVPGLQTALPLMLTAVAAGRLTLDRLVELMATTPRRVFALPDPPATYVEIDPAAHWTLRNSDQYTRCGWTPFDGHAVQGQIRQVVLRGQDVVRDGTVLAAPGSGHVLQPTPSVQP
ncbi:MAG: amidohydrolase family protein [Chloroflexota bacterium]|nr:amidohydrolase family protein [Chloroflexota bacterium]